MKHKRTRRSRLLGLDEFNMRYLSGEAHKPRIGEISRYHSYDEPRRTRYPHKETKANWWHKKDYDDFMYPNSSSNNMHLFDNLYFPPNRLLDNLNSHVDYYTPPYKNAQLDHPQLATMRFTGKLRSFTPRSYGFIDSPDLFRFMGISDVFIHHIELPSKVRVGDNLHFTVTPPNLQVHIRSAKGRPCARDVHRIEEGGGVEFLTPVTACDEGSKGSSSSSEPERVGSGNSFRPEHPDCVILAQALREGRVKDALISCLHSEARWEAEQKKKTGFTTASPALRFLLQRVPDPADSYDMEMWLYCPKYDEDGLKALIVYVLLKLPGYAENLSDGETSASSRDSEDEEDFQIARFRWIHEMALALNLDGDEATSDQVRMALCQVLTFDVWNKPERWRVVSQLKERVHHLLLSLRERLGV